MNDNHQLVKNVSHALNYYMNIKRREESFDTRLVNRNPPRYNSLVIPSINKKSPQNYKLKDAPNEDLKVREQFFKDELKYHLGWNRSKRLLNRSESMPRKTPSSGNNQSSVAHSRTSDRRKNHPVNSFLPTDDVMSSHVIRREKKEMIDLTSRILTVTSDLCFSKRDLALLKSLSKKKQSTGRSVCYKQLVRRNPPPPREDQDTSEYGAENNRGNDSNNMPRLTVEEKDTDYESRPEVKSGPSIIYKVVVKTSDRLGSSSEADIFLQLFGSKGKSKMTRLKKSLCHKIPFRRANVDIFEVKCYDLGTLDAIKIGHNEQDIEHSWFMDSVRVEDSKYTISYNFVCNDWFSVKSADRKTMRILPKKSQTCVIEHVDEASLVSYSTEKRSSKLYSAKNTRSSSSSVASSDSDFVKSKSSFTGSANPVTSESSKNKTSNKSSTILGKNMPSSSSSSRSSSASSRHSSRQPNTKVSGGKSASPATVPNKKAESKKKTATRSSSSSSSSSSSGSRQQTKDSEKSKGKKASPTPPPQSLTKEEPRRRARKTSSSSSSSDRTKHSSKPTVATTASNSTDKGSKKKVTTRSSSSSSSSSDRTKHSSMPTLTTTGSSTEKSGGKKVSVRKLSTSSSSSSRGSSTSRKQQQATKSTTKTQDKQRRSPADSDAEFKAARQARKQEPKSRNFSTSASSASSSSLSDSSARSSLLGGDNGKSKQAKKSVRVTTASSSDTNRISRPKTKSPLLTTVPSVKSMNVSTFEAVRENRLDLLKEAVSANKQKELKASDNKGNTLMSVACEHGHVTIVKYLAELDQSLVNKQNIQGYAPVHFCAKLNHLDCLKVLEDYRATLQLRTHEGGFTPLHLAAAEGNLEIVKWLSEKKINLNNYDDRSRTALDLAREKGQHEVVEYLESIRN